MTTLSGIHHVSVLVSDTQRALRFYHGVLGLPLDHARPEMGFPGAWLWIGQQQLHLLELPEPHAARRPTGHGGRDRHVALLIDDLDGLRQALDAHAIAYTLSRSGRRALFCHDPDGNALEIIEQKSA